MVNNKKGVNMGTGDNDDGTPPEAKSFQAPPDAKTESKAEKMPPSPSGLDREPTEAELEFYRNMTHEEWDARVAKGKEEIAGIVAQREEDHRQHEERQREKWGRKTKALEAIQPTGNPIEDAQAFFEAIQLDPNTLDSQYKTAYQNGDREGMLKYFKDVEKSAGTLPASMNQYAVEYFRKFDEVVKKIISTAETVGKRQ